MLLSALRRKDAMLRLTTPDDEDIARSCTGREVHLLLLLAAIEWVPIQFLFARFQLTRQAYKDLL